MNEVSMPSIRREVVSDPAAWKGRDLKTQDSWIYRFSARELDELDAAMRSVTARGLALERIDRFEFPLPTLAARLPELLEEIQSGRGFVVLRGLPVDRYADREVETIFWGLGAHLGDGLRQNATGDLLGHVYDHGKKFGAAGVRGYESNAHLPFHTDYSDIVGLLCLRRAKSGGLSSIVSSITLHNEIARRRPDYLEPLYRGFHYVKREVELSENPVTETRIPVFGQQDGKISCRYLRVRIEAASRRTGRPLSQLEREALDFLDALAQDPDLHLDMDLQPGDVQLCNDLTILHSRTGYEDWPDPRQARHMLRLWLRAREHRRPLPPDFPPSNGYARQGEPGFESALALGLLSGTDAVAAAAG
jgi:hypothetical protein